MHSCSDKRERVRSGAAQHMLLLQRLKRLLHAAVWPQEGGWGGGRGVFLIPGFCRACGESSQRDGDKRMKVNRASSSPGRKEEFPLASDCLTCKNVAFVAGLCSFFWQAVCDQLSPFPLFSHSLFLCRFTCLPSNPVCLDSARL